MFKYQVMNNGLRVISHEQADARSVAIAVFAKVGSRFETEEEHGITHFIEHLVFKGTKKRRNSFLIANEVERVGGFLNAETGREYTAYLVKLPYQYLNLGIDILNDMLVNSLFCEDDILSEGKVVLEEISTYKDTPSEYIFDLLGELMWPNQALGRSELGTPETITNVTREKIIKYMDTHYLPGNMVVSIAGNASHERVLSEISSYFNFENNHYHYSIQGAVSSQDSPKLTIERKDTDEAHLCFGLRTIPRKHPDVFILKIVDTLLGKGMSCRLFQELRDKKGLAYNVSSHPALFWDTGAFIVYAGVTLAKVSDAIEIILKEFKNIRQGKITKEELINAKEFYKGYLSLELEDTLKMTEWLGMSLITEDECPSLDELFEKIDKVSIDDIVRFSEDFFINKNLNAVLIGPYENEKSFMECLNL